MNPSRLFILRPVATSLLMVAILLAGAIAYRLLPLSALPEVDYPTIQVVTFYPGASPDVTTSSITAPLERQLGQMPGLKQMSSTSSGGASVITLQFSLELTLDVAEQEVQAAINAGSNFLPADLPAPPVYSKVNPADAPILTLGITSKTMPLPQVQNLVDTRLAQKISQLPGVGLVTLSGGQRPAVRVQVNPRALAASGLNLEDVRTAVASANVNQAKGSFDGPSRAYTDDAHRPHRHHPRVGQGRAVRAGARGGPGRDGDLPFPAHGRRHHHPEHRGAALPDRHLRRDVPRRVQRQQPHADGAHHRHRLRRGRRDRDDREHRPLHRGRRAALAGGAERRRADRLHHHLADVLAHRGADPAALHGRGGGAPVPRVRDHARRRHPDLGGRVAHLDAHDVR